MFTFAHTWVLIPKVERRLRIGGFMVRLELYGDELWGMGAVIGEMELVVRLVGEVQAT